MSLRQSIFNQLEIDYEGQLQAAQQRWQTLHQGKVAKPSVIIEKSELLLNVDFDVLITGGTLGIILATALVQRGVKVILIERGTLQGRDQEWNISRSELKVLLELELLSEAELNKAIATEFNPVKLQFHQGQPLYVQDVLNLGVSPRYLLATLKEKFLTSGGTLLEHTPFQQAAIHPNGVELLAGNHTLTGRLLIDAMGHFSPITQQARKNPKPQGICLVVGSCGQGYTHNSGGDLIVSFTPIINHCQYFWEAFPAKDGRTTYLFTYLPAIGPRPSLDFLVEEYLRLLPSYQETELAEINFKRFLFGFFPSYRPSPLSLPWQRVLAIGDSAGAQSPVSFGGFGAMLRHLERLTTGIQEALAVDELSHNSLKSLQPYQPNLSVNWLFQQAMSVPNSPLVDPDQINNLMNGVFTIMAQQGEEVLKPFLQDVIQFGGLTKTLPLVNPLLVLPILSQIGLPNLMDWMLHYSNLGIYTALYPLGKLMEPGTKYLTPQQRYYYHRLVDAYKYGSGADYYSNSQGG